MKIVKMLSQHRRDFRALFVRVLWSKVAGNMP